MIGFAPMRHIGPVCLAAALGVISTSAWSQAVTFAELEDMVIDVQLLRQQTVRREGKVVSNRAQADVRLAIGSGGSIHATITPTGHNERGSRTGKPASASFVLGETRDMLIRGGGHGIWTFENGTLTYLRIFKGGAMKWTMAFARGADGLTCKASENFVREVGVNGIVTQSALDGVPIVILSAKQISSSCRVAKQDKAADQ
jgi:hypothetical protein